MAYKNSDYSFISLDLRQPTPGEIWRSLFTTIEIALLIVVLFLV